MKLTLRNILHYAATDCLEAIYKSVDPAGIQRTSILEPEGLQPYEESAYRAVRRTVAKKEKKTLNKINKIIDKVDPESPKSITTGVKAIEKEITEYGIKIAPPSSQDNLSTPALPNQELSQSLSAVLLLGNDHDPNDIPQTGR